MTKYLYTLCLCLIVQALAAQTTGSLVFGGLTRSYIVYAPPATGTPLPLVLVLHGLTQTAQGIMAFSNFNEVAAEQGFVAVYPNGVGTSWNVGFAGGSIADDVGFLDALIDAVRASYLIDTERIYACGMSNGGFMSYRLACELSERIAAIASVTGTMSTSNFNACQPSRAVPTLQIHGTSDIVVNYDGSVGIKSVEDVLDYWIGHNNCAATPTVEMLPDLVAEGSTVERYTYAGGNQGAEVMHLKVISGGHTWPGAAAISGIGNTNRDISATREIWDFFSRHTLSGLVTAVRTPQTVELALWPNPARGTVELSLPAGAAAGGYTGRLTSAHGIAVPVALTVQGGSASFSVEGLPAGFYVLELIGGDGTWYRAKMLVSKD